MSVIPNQVPERRPSGLTSDPPYGPWAAIGVTNPFFYHLFEDDFDNSLGTTGEWTITKTTGTAVQTPGDGGLALLTTAATNADFVSMQLPAANFTAPQGTLAGKKAGFLARMTGLSDVVASAFILGMVDTTTTPFAAITDGIWFSKASASAQININVAKSSTTFTYAIPTADYVLANATQIDFAWVIDRYGNLLISIGAQLVGWVPQSGYGANTSAPEFYSTLPVLCPISKLYSGNQATYAATVGYVLPTANLNPTIAVQAGAAVAKTMTVDFIAVAKER